MTAKNLDELQVKINALVAKAVEGLRVELATAKKDISALQDALGDLEEQLGWAFGRIDELEGQLIDLNAKVDDE